MAMADTEWLDDHIELYAIDALPPAENERVRRELDDLSPVELRIYRARITDVRSAVTDLASGFALAAPTELRETVLDRVFTADSAPHHAAEIGTDRDPDSDSGPGDDSGPGADGTSTVVALDHARNRRRRVSLAVGAAAVTVAVALGAGVLIGRSTAPESTPSTTTAQQVSDILAAPDARSTVSPLADDRGTVTVVSSKSANRAVALLRDQRNRLAADQTFQLWLIGKSDKPVSAGLADGAGAGAPVVIDALDASRVLAVTIEPQGGSPQPTSAILTQVPL